ncbi:nitrilase-related carbon-nitrogen hydrolase [Mumia sp. DW29H23]|uniref:nitrilase-related carbon-nitrogen hydrolase n=1 Tax=Mumia sp. DW29H23 TaxID=3421241 RepID=UPI003D6919CB
MKLVTTPALPSLTPVAAGEDTESAVPLRIGVVQHRWREDPEELTTSLDDAIGQAADAGARVVFLPELTLSRYPADVRAGEEPDALAEDLEDGPTYAFAARAAAAHGVHVHASLYRRARDASSPDDRRGLNTAILVSPAGDLVALTDKLHIPVTTGYYEDTWFRPGAATDPYPVHRVGGLDDLRVGMPTCWDEWFPEVARAYALGGAELVVYPTAIGSEPDYPDFDTQPLLRTVVTAHGITAGTFMVVPNRTGDEGTVRFYGSSFVSDPYGRVLVEAPRDEEAVLVTDVAREQRRDWLTLFPFLRTRRPDTYDVLTRPVDAEHPFGGGR